MEKIYSTTAEMKKGTKRLLAMALALLMMCTNLGDVALGVVALADEIPVATQIPLTVDMEELQQKLDNILGEDGEPVNFVLPSYGEGDEAAALDKVLQEDVASWLSGKTLLDAITYQEDEKLLVLVAAIVGPGEESGSIAKFSVRVINTGHEVYSFATTVSGAELESAEMTLGEVVSTYVGDLVPGASDIENAELPAGASSLNFTAKVKSESVELSEEELNELSGSSASLFRSRAVSSGFGLPVEASGVSTLDIQPLVGDSSYTATAILYDYKKNAINSATQTLYNANRNAYPNGAMYFTDGSRSQADALNGGNKPQNVWDKGGKWGPYQGLVQSSFVNGNIAFKDVAQANFFDGKTDNTKDAYTNVAFPFTKGADGYYVFDSDETKLRYDTSSGAVTTSGYTGSETKGFYPFEGSKYATGLQMSIPFVMGEGGFLENNNPMIFEFTGDDDLWVFIDGKLVLDMGGLNGEVKGFNGLPVPTGTINFATGKVTYSRLWKSESSRSTNVTRDIGFTISENAVHNMQIFYMERGEGDSNCKMKFALETLPAGSVTVNKQVFGNEPADAAYNFTLYTGSSSGSLTTETDFTLAAGKSITFDDLAPGSWYKVKETSAGSDAGYSTYWSANATGGFNQGTETDAYQVEAAGAGLITFTNTYSESAAPSLNGDKMVTARSEGGNYDITVSIDPRNGFQTIENPAQLPKSAQIVLVMDISTSMNWPMTYTGSDQSLFVEDTDPTQRWYVLKNAAAAFIESVLGNGNPGGNQIAIVGYANGSGVLHDYSSDIESLTSSFLGKSTKNLRDVLGIISATNCQAGLNTARNLILNNADAAKDQYVIFMTDGEANRSNNLIDGDYGKDNYDRAVNMASWIKNNDTGHMDGKAAKIFSIGVTGTLSNSAQAMLKGIANTNTTPFYLHGSNVEKLTEAFDTVAGEITKYQFTTLRNHNVVLTDTMSQYVELVHADGTPITDDAPFDPTVDVVRSHDIGTVEYNPTTKTLIWSIPNEVKPLHYTLTYHVNVLPHTGGFVSGDPAVAGDYTSLEGSNKKPANNSAVITSDDAENHILPVPEVYQKANIVKFKKVDNSSNDGAALKGVRFDAYLNDETGPIVATAISDENGHVVFELYDEKYVITENPLSGYIGVKPIKVDFSGQEGSYAKLPSENGTITTNQPAVTLKTKDQQGNSYRIPAGGIDSISWIRVKNDRAIDGKVVVTKLLKNSSGAEIPIEGEFHVGLFTESNGIYTLVGNQESPDFSNPQLIAQSTGKAVFTNVPYGTYYVLETNAAGDPVDKTSYPYKVTDGDLVVVDSKDEKTATVTNEELNNGSLTVVKKLESTSAEFAKGKTFNFKLYSGSAAIGDVLHTGTATFGDSIPADGVIVEWNTPDKTLSSLAYGTYTVVEAPHAMFEAVGAGASQQAVITINQNSKTLTFTNQPKQDASLKIAKVVTEAPETGVVNKFEFKLYTKNGSAMTLVTLSSNNAVNANGNIEVSVSGEKAVFDLTYGTTYYVKEENIPEGYELTGADGTLSDVGGEKYYAITIDQNGKIITFTNTAKRYNTALKVQKTVSDTWLLGEDVGTRSFTFQLTGPGINSPITASVTVDQVTGKAEAVSFPMPEGGWKAGTYTITETATPGSAYHLTGMKVADKTVSANANGSYSVTLTAADLAKAGGITFEATNKVKRANASATVQKTLTSGAWLNPGNFNFTLKLPDGTTKNFSVAPNGQPVTIDTTGWSLPSGQYTLTEEPDNSFALTADGLNVLVNDTKAGNFDAQTGVYTFTLGANDFANGSVTLAFEAKNQVKTINNFGLTVNKELVNTTAAFANGKNVAFTLTGPDGAEYTGTASFDSTGLVKVVSWNPALPANWAYGSYTLRENTGNVDFALVANDAVTVSGTASAVVNQNAVTFTIGAASNGKNMTVLFKNEPLAAGSLTISKEFAQGSMQQSADHAFGFKLYKVNSDGTVTKVKSGAASTNNAVVYSDLQRGEYLLVEDAKDGYLLNGYKLGGGQLVTAFTTKTISGTSESVSGFAFTLSGTNAVTVAMVNSNTKGAGFTLAKSLNTNGLVAEEFTFNLYKGDTLVAVGITGDYTDGLVKTANVTWKTLQGQPLDVSMLDVGTYTLNEVISAQSNYKFEKFVANGTDVTENSYTFTVTGDGSIRTVVAHNGPDSVESRTVTVKKTLTSGFGLEGSFGFVITNAANTRVGEGSVAVGETGLTAQASTQTVIDALANLPNGVYTVTENITGSFDLTGVSGANRTANTNSATFTLLKNVTGEVVITFTNAAKTNSGFGVTVSKVVDSINATNKTFTFVLTEPNGTKHTGSLTKTAAASENVVTWTPALPTSWEYGDYTLVETETGDYDFAGVTGGTKLEGQNGVMLTVGEASTAAAITFTNHRKDAAGVTLQKLLAGGSSLVNPADTFDFEIWEAGSFSKANWNDLAAADEATAISGLKAGATYLIREVPQSNYKLDSFKGNNSVLTVYNADNGSYKFTVPSDGSTLALVATNSNKTASMSVSKAVTGEDFAPDTQFAITVSGAGLAPTGVTNRLTAGGSANLSGLRIGETYTVSETDVDNYELVSITIEKAGMQTVTLGANHQFVMSPDYVGATIKVTNKMPVSGDISVQKIVNNSLGMTAPAFGFELYAVNGETETLIATASTAAGSTDASKTYNLSWTVESGKTHIFNGTKLIPGTYRVREDALAENSLFELTGIFGGTTGPDDYSVDFTVAEGGTAAITFTNSLKTWDGSSVDVAKAFAGSTYGMEKGKSFGFSITGPAGAARPVTYTGSVSFDASGVASTSWNQTTRTFVPGEYTITETGDLGDFNYNSISVAGASATAVSGQKAVTVNVTAAMLDEGVKVTMTNSVKTGAGLTMEKVLSANGLANETFTFALRGVTNSFVAYGKVTGSGSVVWYDSADADASIINVATLPVGSYTITENAMAANSNYKFEKFTVNGAPVMAIGSTTQYADNVRFDVTEAGTAIVVAAFNTVKTNGKLTITKVADTKDFKDTFTFTLTGPVVAGAAASEIPTRTITINSATGMTGELTGLPYGTYTLKENDSSHFSFDEFVGYEDADGVIQLVISSDNKEIAVTAKNVLKTGEIQIQKTVVGTWGDITAKTFKFDLYQKKSDGKFTKVGDTREIAMNAGDNTKALSIPNLEYGVYKVVELEDADFRLVANSQIKGALNDTPEQILTGAQLTFTAANELRTSKGQISLKKVAIGGKNLVSETFTFELRKGNTVLYNGKVGSHTADAAGGAYVLWTPKSNPSAQPANAVSELQIGADYSIVETSTSKNFSGAAAQGFTVTEAMENQSFTMENVLGSDGQVTVTKMFDGINTFPETQFTFVLTGPVVNSDIPVMRLAANNQQSIILSSDKLTDTLNNLPYGNYTLTELSDVNYEFLGFEAGQGYTISQDNKTAFFTIDGDHKSFALTGKNRVKSTDEKTGITLNKVFKNNYVPFEDEFTFTLTGPITDGNEASAQSIQLTTTELQKLAASLKYGRYTLTESGDGAHYEFDAFTAAAGAEVSQDGKTLSFTIGEKEGQNTNFTFTAQNKVLTNGALTVKNVVDSKSNPYPDQDFTFTVTIPQGAGLTKLVDETGKEYTVANGRVTFTLKDGGEKKFANLPLGEYVVEEASGLLTGHNRYNFKGFSEESDKTLNPTRLVLTGEVPEAVRTAHNDIRTDGSITIRKEMAPGSVVLNSGELFTFELYHGELVDDQIKWSAKPVEIMSTTAERSVRFENLTLGVPYQVREMAIDGYRLLGFDGEETFTAVLDSEMVEISGTATNQTIVGDLRVHKLSTRNNLNNLSGAGFTLYRYDGEKNDTVVRAQKLTGDDGMVTFEKLPLGTYLLKETKVPSYHTISGKNSFIVEIALNEEGKIVVIAEGAEMEDAITLRVVNTYRRPRPDPDPDPDPTPGGDITIIDPNLPLGNLPNAGGLPVGVLSIVGAGLAFTGWAIGRKKDDEDDDDNE